MKRFDRVVALSAGLLMIATVASSAAGQEAEVRRLAEAKREIAAKANGQKGYPRARLDQERLRVTNLIDDLEAGKMVDSQAVDEALERASHADR